ncbi:MAG: hypothetical protein EZS26_001297 [Candidatus Ordinivivax streblomastigis]|uniref:Uncharacterized protein n=1 Tax=Candidatus Ordinivivax streblomastigis TaxID=2540710 RepID=A0A5M8P1Z1_9BACT|nr:MAG: hypothetical protein EZS26_001297 [Candidatus Ordinivivax streblomastigis]
MKTLFDYCYYRISKFYKSFGESGYHFSGGVVLFGCIGFNLLSLCIFILSLFDREINLAFIYIVVIITGIFGLIFSSKKKYQNLEKQYKNEENSKLKGWLVLLYGIGSVVLYFISMILCGYWVNAKI